MDVFNLAASITLDTNDYENSLDNAGKKTSGFGDKLKNGLATAAKVGAASIAAVTAATTALTAAMVKGVGNTAAYGDNIDKMSQKMGMSAEAYQEWDAVMQHSGTSIDSLQAGMKTLANAVESGNDAFDRLGISQKEIASMSNEELFSATITALQNVDNETERTYLAGQLLGRGATELGALLNTSAEDTQAMKDRVHELGGVMSNEAVKASAAYQDSLQDMQTAFSGLSRGLTSNFMPSITTVMDGLTEIFSGNGDTGVSMVTQGVSGIIENIQTAIPRFLEIGGQIVNSLYKAISENIPKIIYTGTEMLVSLVSGIISALPKIGESAIDIITTLADGISEQLPTLVPVAMDAVLGLAETLTDPDSLGNMIDSAIQLIMSLADGLINAIPRLVEKAPIIIQNLVTAIVNNVPKLIQAGIDLIVKLGAGMIQAIPKLIKNIPQIITAIVKGFFDLRSKVVDIGKNIVSGVWEGIKGMASWLKDKVVGFFSGIVDDAKDFLGIHSPSKVFAGIGGNMALGIGEGWDDQFNDIKKKIGGDMDFEATGVSIAQPNASFDNGIGVQQFTGRNITIPVTLELDGATLVSKTFRLFQNEGSRVGPAMVQV